MIKRRTRVLAWFFITLVLLATRPSVAAPAPPIEAPEYAPGQVLIALRSAVRPSALSELLGAPQAREGRQLLPNLYLLDVPEGRETAMARTLATHPAVAYASPNYLITEPPLTTPGQFLDRALDPSDLAVVPDSPLELPDPQPAQASSCVVQGTLRMSLTPGGLPLPENTVPSGSTQVYVVFDYEDCDAQLVRAQVYWLDAEPAPEIFYSRIEVLDSSGTKSIPVPAWEYFEEGIFPVGQYLTLLQVPPEEAPNGGWVPIDQDSWHVSTRPNDLWYLSTSNYQWPLYNTGHWGLPDADIDAAEAWDVTTGWDGMTVAIISTGVAMDHEDLANKIWVNKDEIPGNGQDDDNNGYVDDVHGYDFAGNNLNDPANEDPDPTDQVGYGTFAAGIAAAETNNEVGMAGVCWNCAIMPVKVLSPIRLSNGAIWPAGYVSDLIDGLRYAVDNGAQVIYSAPLVSSDDPNVIGLLQEAVRDVVNRGALVIVPVGDDGKDLCRYPACFKEVLSVGATDARDELWASSNWGPYLDLVAPGALILSTCQPGLPFACPPYGVVRSDQTAWAAAHVAGAAALVWSLNPDRTPQQVQAVLERTADDLGAPGKDDRYGYGRLNVGQAVREPPHRLTLEPSELRFLISDGMGEVCQTLSNPAMGPFAWGAVSAVDWLTVKGPLGPYTPSRIEVCVEPSGLAEYTVYQAPLTVFSRIDPGASVPIPVLVNRIGVLWQSFLPSVLRFRPVP